MHIVFSLHCNSFAYIEEKDENCATDNALALLIPNQFVLDDCPHDYGQIGVLNTGKISPPFYIRPLTRERIHNWAN